MPLWDLYDRKYIKTFSNVSDAFNSITLNITEECEYRPQPYHSNEGEGHHIEELFEDFHGNIIFEEPLSCNMDIIIIAHLKDHTIFLLRSDKTPYYFHDQDWA